MTSILHECVGERTIVKVGVLVCTVRDKIGYLRVLSLCRNRYLYYLLTYENSSVHSFHSGFHSWCAIRRPSQTREGILISTSARNSGHDEQTNTLHPETHHSACHPPTDLLHSLLLFTQHQRK